MRIRTIKPEYFRHEELFDLEKESGLPMRVAYAGLWCVADREGRFAWRVRTLKSEVLPFDDVDFSRVLDALLTRGFLKKYRCSGEWFGVIPSFRKHQFINPREKESVIPDISDAECVDESSTREPRVDDACIKEGKGKEGEEIDKRGRLQPKPIPTLDECLNVAQVRGIPEECARWFWNKNEAISWKVNGTQVTNWEALLTNAATTWRAGSGSRPGKPRLTNDQLDTIQSLRGLISEKEQIVRTNPNPRQKQFAAEEIESLKARISRIEQGLE